MLIKDDIKTLVEQMTLEEKASLCSGRDFWNTKAVKRLGIQSYMMTDGPHGLRKQTTSADHLGLNQSVASTCFPSGAGLASTWNKELLHKVGKAIGKEAKANEVGIVLGPAVNIKRSPLCGRSFEYYSEDPYLVGSLAKHYIDGMQSEGVGACIKHFAANNQETNRLLIDVEADERTLREIYFAAFETAVKQGKPWSVMSAYNRLDGDYCSENKWLLTTVLRDEWGFDGAVISDWGANNLREAGLEAGLDIEMPGNGGLGDSRIIKAVEEGKLDEAYLDGAVERILKLYFRVKEGQNSRAAYDPMAHHALAKAAAWESIVLLKNENGLLPLKKWGTVAFIGAFAKQPRYQGSGSSRINPHKLENAVDSAAAMQGVKITYARGYDKKTDKIDETLMREAVDTAKNADTAVLFVGLTEQYESEGYDRYHLRMPDNHIRLIEEVSAVQKNVAVVLMNGAPVEMPWLDKAGAVLETYLGGQASGSALLDVLFGEMSPCGKLAETFPMRLADNPSFLDFPGNGRRVRYREGIYVGYRYYDIKEIEPLFPFGFGLSYTRFAYSNIQTDKDNMKDTETVTVTAEIRNTGGMAGSEIVQLYVRDPGSEVSRPDKELKGFEKVYLEAGEQKKVSFALDKRAFAIWDEEIKDWRAQSGPFEILIGASSRDIRLCASIQVESTTQVRRVYSRNTSIGELLAHPVAGKWAGRMKDAFISAHEQSEPGSPEALMLEAFTRELPIRNLAMMHVAEEEDIEQIVAELNGQTGLKVLK